MSAQDKTGNGAQPVEGANTSTEADLDSIMQELETLDQQREQIEAEAHTPASTETPKAEAAPVPMRPATAAKRAKTTNSALSQSLTLELTGTLNLKLGFVTGSKSVELICTDDALVCRFGDGTEVRIPTENPRATTFRRTA